MADVYLESLPSSVWFQLEKQISLSHDFLIGEITKHLGVARQNVQFKFFHGHLEILPGTCAPWPKSDTFVRTSISLAGGKGGFGSMLRYIQYHCECGFSLIILIYVFRAIGAQIEKTTNREACRDLSGRRLRDINEEKRYIIMLACLLQ